MKISNRNIYLDICRCICNYIIVLLHAEAVAQYCSPESVDFSFWTFVCEYLCPTALPVLFCISGYFMFYNYDINKYSLKLKSRFRRLVVPYICWNILFVVLYLSVSSIFPRIEDRVIAFGLTSFSGVFSKIISLTVHPIDGPLWFLRTLFIYSILSPILWIFVRNRIGNIIGLIILSIGCWEVIKSNMYSELSMTYPPYSLFAFIIGGIFAQNKRFCLDKKTVLLLVVTGIISLFGFQYVLVSIKGTDVGLFVSVLVMMIKMGVAFGLIYFLPAKSIYASNITKYLISISFFVYAGHFLICSIFLHLSAHYFINMFDFKYTVLIVLYCIPGLLTLSIIYSVLHERCPKLLSLFDGTF